MGGFIKGVATGIVSFGLGFAVLSVLFPVPQGDPAGEQVFGDAEPLAAGRDLVAEVPSSGGDPAFADRGVSASVEPASEPSQQPAEPPEAIMSPGDEAEASNGEPAGSVAAPDLDTRAVAEVSVSAPDGEEVAVRATLEPADDAASGPMLAVAPELDGTTTEVDGDQGEIAAADVEVSSDGVGSVQGPESSPVPPVVANAVPDAEPTVAPDPDAAANAIPSVERPLDHGPSALGEPVRDGANDPAPATAEAPGTMGRLLPGTGEMPSADSPSTLDATYPQATVTEEPSVDDPEAIMPPGDEPSLASPDVALAPPDMPTADLDPAANAGAEVLAATREDEQGGAEGAPSDGDAPPVEETPQEGIEPFAVPAAPSPQTLPRVQAMPSGVPDITVRRGGAGGTVPTPDGVEGVTVGRLPSIGGEADADPEPQEAQPEAPGVGFDRALPAYLRFGATVEPLGELRPLGVLLFEEASAESTLIDLPMPVTLAMDPFDPDAPRRARAYRDAGHEIALLARNIPSGASATDIALTLDAFFRGFPETMALVDVTTDPIANSRALARELSLMLEPEGYGVIARRPGLDAFLGAAHDAGLAATGIYRVIDDAGQSETTMRRLIDRAAFEAARSDGILIAGSADNPDTLAALADWTQQAGRDGVILMPASTVLTSE